MDKLSSKKADQKHKQQSSTGRKPLAASRQSQAQQELSDDTLIHVLSFLPQDTLTTKVSMVSSRFAQASSHPYLRERRELICFHTRAPFEEQMLGIGFSFQFSKRSKKIESASSPLDLLSWEAYDELKVRKGLWNVPFEHFLPLYINAEHAARSMHMLEKQLPIIYDKIEVQASSRHVVTLAVDLLSKLMNGMVVAVMKLNLHASLRALDGFLAFHRILIHFCKYPTLLDIIDDKIDYFLRSERARSKNVTANLGEFLVLFLLSERYSWNDIKQALVQEVFDRNALWISLKYPELARVVDGENMSDRISKSFEATQVSNRLIAFNYFFVEKIVGKGQADCPTLDDIASDYDSRFGRASEEMRVALQQAIQKDIVGISSLYEYLEYINAPVKGEQELYDMLCDSMENGKRRHYLARPEGDVPRETKSSRRNFVRQERPAKPKPAAATAPTVTRPQKTNADATQQKRPAVPSGLSRLESSFVIPAKNGNVRINAGADSRKRE